MSSSGLQGVEEFRSETPASEPGDELLQILTELYRRQLAIDPANGYMIEHGRARNIAKQVVTFRWYLPYLPRCGSVLDWGCNHAPDSCLLRAACGNRLQLHGCDFADPASFQPFHDFAQLAYSRLDDPVLLTYGRQSFDVVIASGVLEHTAMDRESLKELYRVLKPDGLLIITHLPNWLSYEEFLRRHVRKTVCHRRLYGMRETTHLLKHSGFYPICGRYHTFLRERILQWFGLKSADTRRARLLYRLLPLNVFSSTLCFLARKVRVM